MDPVARSALHLALERLFNKVLALDPASAPRLHQWDGKMLGLCLQPPGLELALLFLDSQVRVFSQSDGQSDALVTGTPLALLRFLTPAASAPAADIQVTGDQQLVEEFRQLLQELEPDWEAELAQHLGDVIAHEAGRRLRQGFRWGQQTHRTLLANLAEYVTEESRLLPPRAELEARLLEPLPQLEESLNELEQRIQQLERRLRQPSTSH